MPSDFEQAAQAAKENAVETVILINLMK
jgi:hypothetical protein